MSVHQSHQPQRYDLKDLVHIISNIDSHNSNQYVSTANLEKLKEHTALCVSLREQEQKQEREAGAVVAGEINQPLRLVTPKGHSTNLPIRSRSHHPERERLPISQHSQRMFPSTRTSDGHHESKGNIGNDGNPSNESSYKAFQFNHRPLVSETQHQVERRVSETELSSRSSSMIGLSKTVRFLSEKDRQQYYRPREWRTRRRGEWTDSGPYVNGSNHESVEIGVESV